MEGTIGEVRMFAGNFPPQNWAFCDGTLKPISQYDAAYAIMGTIYGGDGVNTFAVPDLRGRLPVGTGQGAGTPYVVLGQIGGAESVTLTTNTMAPHVHVQMASGGEPVTNTAAGGLPATNGRGTTPPMPNIYGSADSQVAMQPTGVSPGGSQPFSIIQPVLSTNYVVCLIGVFPSRN